MLKPSNSPPSNGWIGSTTGACSSRSETSRPPRRKPPTMPSLSPSQWPRRTQTNLPPGNPVRFTGEEHPDRVPLPTHHARDFVDGRALGSLEHRDHRLLL